jgi:hypothetical protein
MSIMREVPIQSVEGGTFRHADMGRGCDFEAAAHHRAVQHCDHRHFAELNGFEGAMPGPRMLDAGKNVALGKLGEIEAGAEMLAFAGEHDSADLVRQRREEGADAVHHLIVESIAFRRAIEPQHRDRAMTLRLQGRRQVGKFGW